jgi:hypothetical protein
MERRTFMALVSGGFLAAPLVAEGQKPEKSEVAKSSTASTRFKAPPSQLSFHSRSCTDTKLAQFRVGNTSESTVPAE